MDKSCHSSGGAGGPGEPSSISTTATSSSTNGNTNSTSTSSRDPNQYLKQLNKLSHKISKPTPPNIKNNLIQKNHIPPPAVAQEGQMQQQQLQHQPPVYNINKSDFRDVVQKLTGSPAHERFSTPPPIHQPKPPSSRLQRIRPPPLVQVNNRPPPLLDCIHPPLQPPNTGSLNPNHLISSTNSTAGCGAGNIIGGQRQPLSPLPPLPAVHAAAESPISAYMRYFQSSIANTDSDSRQFSGHSPLAPLVSPRWNGLAGPQPPPPSQQQNIPPPAPATSMPQLQFPMIPSSPLPFGCWFSPKSAYPLFSPSLLLSPNGQLGFQQLPLSPTLPVPSPKWKGL